MSFDVALSVVSVAGAVVSIASAIGRAVGAYITQRRKLKEATEMQFRRVLSSDDLSEIGSYLDDVIGEFEIAEYVGNPTVSQRVDAYIEKLTEFVQADFKPVEEEEAPERAPLGEALPPVGDELSRVLEELREGDAWNALARLRRHMEIRLRQVASRHDIMAGQQTSAGRLVESLYRAQVLDEPTRWRFLYAISICNRAIHGLDISMDDAEKAIDQAATALGALAPATDVPASGYAEVGEAIPRVPRSEAEAEETARQEGEGLPDREQLWTRAQVLVTSGHREQGAELLEQVVGLDLTAGTLDANVLNQLSGLLDQLGQYERAIKYADLAVARFRNDVGARFNKAVIEIHRGGSASDERGKRRHWRGALKSFDVARRLHKAGTRMNDADHGKMWLFAGETAQYIAELGPTPECRSDWLQKAAAWYNEGYIWLLEAQRRVTEATAALVGFWLNNAHERTLKVHSLDRQADAEGLRRDDIARLDSDIPFWREGDEAEFRRLVGSDGEGGER